MSEDRISELPEALLVKILSTVPTKEVIATSVLSKRWRSVWKMVPNLKFGSEIDHLSSKDVYRLLILHKAPFLECLHLEIKDTRGRLDIGILIGIAFSRHVRELVLDLHDEDQKTVRFPSVLCSYNNTLEVLKLEYHVLLHFPSPVCFNALRELHLYLVEFKDEASVRNLLSGCPRLQDLVVTRYHNFDAETYTIDVPSLQRLTIEEDSSTDVDGGGYVINAPSLKYLNIQFLSFIDFFVMENVPEELVEAKIGHIPHIANENIFASLTSAKRLALYLPLEIKYPTGSIFYQLVFLEYFFTYSRLIFLSLFRNSRFHPIRKSQPLSASFTRRKHFSHWWLKVIFFEFCGSLSFLNFVPLFISLFKSIIPSNSYTDVCQRIYRLCLFGLDFIISECFVVFIMRRRMWQEAYFVLVSIEILLFVHFCFSITVAWFVIYFP